MLWLSLSHGLTYVRHVSNKRSFRWSRSCMIMCMHGLVELMFISLKSPSSADVHVFDFEKKTNNLLKSVSK